MKLQLFSSFFVEVNHSIMKKIDIKENIKNTKVSVIKRLTSEN